MSAVVVPLLVAGVWAVLVLAVALPIAAGRADNLDRVLRSQQADEGIA